MNTVPIAVLVIDHTNLYREYLCKCLSEHAPIKVVGQCRTVDEAKRLIAILKPDVVVQEISNKTLLAWHKNLPFQYQHTIVIGLSIVFDAGYQQKVLESGGIYITKRLTVVEMAHTIKMAYAERSRQKYNK